MNIINAKELENIEGQLDFYNFDELSSLKKKQLMVKFNDEVRPVIYSDLQFDGNRKEYEDKEKILLLFLTNLFKKIDEISCIIKKYNEKWVVNNEISPELTNVLTEQLISNRFRGGICTVKDDLIIDLFIRSVFKYNSFVQFIFKENQIIISPSDHLDIFIDSGDIDNLESKILEVFSVCGQDNLVLVKK